MNALLQSIFYLLCVEVLCVSVLVCPLPLRGHLVRLISASNLMSTVGRPLMYFLSLVVLTWLFATREMMRLQSEYAEVKTHADLGIKLQHEAKMHRAQRDFYLSGFAALLLGVIVQLYRLLKEVNQLEATKAAMTKQAEGAAAAYKAANADKEDMARQLKAGGGGGGGGGEEQAAALRKKVASAESAREVAEKSAEALKKQAEGLSAEYARLAREKEVLQHRLDGRESLQCARTTRESLQSCECTGSSPVLFI